MARAHLTSSDRRAVGRAVACAACALGALACVACSAVLGLDRPRLDPCAAGACPDGEADAIALGDGASSDAREGGDAARIEGMRCGGGAFAATACAGMTPVCCQIGDGGATTYACRATAASCEGYPIACTTNADCPGSDVCCHTSGAIKCTAVASCASGSLVCDPDGAADQCPTGWTCGAPLVNAGVTSPYFACTH